ncbi:MULTISPECIES: chromosome segregation protein SMC [unclassified Oleiphilus]|nr:MULTISPECIES: chromosome segregation protein SMC [unclassified Oleiphilus]KZY66061.1 hypothetical protein A3738_07380 [Oleiphilus sp. HI0066]KZY68683.1 hypothetical protein A3739_10690 [Oleiphilus sp. HI0067]
MRLKSIKLVGFKSFVDSTVVPFPTNMTAIVGPNGCGKSNVIDAVRWVMGESSAKHLRGESMTDVIFNGSTHRQPVGKASIELLFDNSEGPLVGEHAAFTEISIKRQVTREGVSQYYLNGAKCRRRDVTDIFLGTGMGPRSYAIIEQGMISRLIESKPEELRVYLEEAAGISKYKERRRETENRMRRTTENLDRLTDIREELSKQLETLKRQANAAERYKGFKANERALKAKISALQWLGLDEQKQELEIKSARCESAVESLVLDKATGQSKIEVLRSNIEESAEAMQSVQARYYQSGAEIAKIEQELKFESQRLQRAESERIRLTEQIRLAEDRLRQGLEERELVSESIAEIEPEIEIVIEQQEAAELKLEESEMAYASWLDLNQQMQEAYTDTRHSVEDAKSNLSRFQREADQAKERVASLDDDKNRLSEELDVLGYQGVGEELAELTCVLEESESSVLARQEDVERLEAVVQESREATAERKSEIAQKQAELVSLETIQRDVVSKGNVGAGLTDLHAKAKGELETLIESIQVEPVWAPVIEGLLGDRLYAYLSNDEKMAGYLLDRSDITFALFSNEQASYQVNDGSLAEKVEGCSALIPFLNRYICAANSSEAFSTRSQLELGQEFVTTEGVLIGRDSVQYLALSAIDDGVVVRQKRIDSLVDELSIADDDVARLEAGLQANLNDLAAAKTSLVDARAIEQSALKRHAQLVADERGAKIKREQLQLRIARIDDDLNSERERFAQSSEQIEACEQELSILSEVLESASEKRELGEGDKERLKNAISESRAQVQDLASVLMRLRSDQQGFRNRLELLNQTLDGQVVEIERFNEAVLNIDFEPGDEDLIEGLESRLQDELVAHERDQKRLGQVRTEHEAFQGQLRDLEQARERSETDLLHVREKLERVRLRIQAFALEQDQCFQNVLEQGFVFEELVSVLADEDVQQDALVKDLESIGQKIARLGAINLAAVEEYETQLERKTYLDEQNDELIDALDVLTQAIRKIDKETRHRFKQTYDRVNAGLQNLFPKIFGGGSAKLELADSDLLETGVSILARPPGKNNSTIHLLSGGEKALTALALIFSIFKLNPAPFCMLDEVDAPLDDANVGRFARLVKEMSDTVQFIYISHNKVSMEMADQLMGVTMHEPGVSRLVSVDIDAAAQLVDA